MEKSTMRIAFTGPESSGKSTLANWFSAFFSIPLATEFARTYLVNAPTYESSDLLKIAQGQIALWPEGTFVADTELHVIQIWSQEKFQQVDPQILDALQRQKFDHYFLCAPDIPWEADPLRENPTDRDRLFKLYKHELMTYNRSYTILSGDLHSRQELIKVTISSICKR
jgi:nicotinamide riboside kinase